jgi:hypothetical protein
VVGWLSAIYYTYLNRAGNPDTLRSLAVELPIAMVLTLLKDDGGALEGLNVANRYAIPTAVAIFKLMSLPLYSLLVRGAPFLVTSAAYADSRPGSIIKGADIVRVTKVDMCVFDISKDI